MHNTQHNDFYCSNIKYGPSLCWVSHFLIVKQIATRLIVSELCVYYLSWVFYCLSEHFMKSIFFFSIVIKKRFYPRWRWHWAARIFGRHRNSRSVFQRFNPDFKWRAETRQSRGNSPQRRSSDMWWICFFGTDSNLIFTTEYKIVAIWSLFIIGEDSTILIPIREAITCDLADRI